MDVSPHFAASSAWLNFTVPHVSAISVEAYHGGTMRTNIHHDTLRFGLTFTELMHGSIAAGSAANVAGGTTNVRDAANVLQTVPLYREIVLTAPPGFSWVTTRDNNVGATCVRSATTQRNPLGNNVTQPVVANFHNDVSGRFAQGSIARPGYTPEALGSMALHWGFQRFTTPGVMDIRQNDDDIIQGVRVSTNGRVLTIPFAVAQGTTQETLAGRFGLNLGHRQIPGEADGTFEYEFFTLRANNPHNPPQGPVEVEVTATRGLFAGTHTVVVGEIRDWDVVVSGHGDIPELYAGRLYQADYRLSDADYHRTRTLRITENLPNS